MGGEGSGRANYRRSSVIAADGGHAGPNYGLAVWDPHELNDGLFIAVEDEDMGYLAPFMESCEACGIPAERLTPAQALAREPNLNPHLKAAVRVPDGTMDAMRLALRFFATAGPQRRRDPAVCRGGRRRSPRWRE